MRTGYAPSTFTEALRRRPANEPLPSWVPDWRVSPRKELGTAIAASDGADVRRTSCGRYHLIELSLWFPWSRLNFQQQDLTSLQNGEGTVPKGPRHSPYSHTDLSDSIFTVVWKSEPAPLGEDDSEYRMWFSGTVLDVWKRFAAILAGGEHQDTRLYGASICEAILTELMRLMLPKVWSVISNKYTMSLTARPRRPRPAALGALATEVYLGLWEGKDQATLKAWEKRFFEMLVDFDKRFDQGYYSHFHERTVLPSMLCRSNAPGNVNSSINFFCEASPLATEGDVVMSLVVKPYKDRKMSSIYYPRHALYFLRHTHNISLRSQSGAPTTETAGCSQPVYRLLDHCRVGGGHIHYIVCGHDEQLEVVSDPAPTRMELAFC
ncbi:hypothetical protein GGR57DRAFT_389640 [Xylariaceae sp. FL1272]|nr:hypothetical protein GGR57DRAFT_389640 [Xylariaceae sp. FL1272]